MEIEILNYGPSFRLQTMFLLIFHQHEAENPPYMHKFLDTTRTKWVSTLTAGAQHQYRATHTHPSCLEGTLIAKQPFYYCSLIDSSSMLLYLILKDSKELFMLLGCSKNDNESCHSLKICYICSRLLWTAVSDEISYNLWKLMPNKSC